MTHLTGACAGRQETITETSFLVGRDPAYCRLCFGNQEQGVSRRHAEITLRNGVLTVTDVGSTYGTFVNGQRIHQPTPVAPGDVVQFGPSGPSIRLEQREAANTASPTLSHHPHSGNASSVAAPSTSRLNSVAAGDERSGAVTLDPKLPYLELLNGAAPMRFILSEATVSIGRDEGNTIFLDPSRFPTVSRRHAVVERRGDGYVVCDLGSFNGTFINGCRIAAPTLLQSGAVIEVGLGGAQLRFVAPHAGVTAGGRRNDGTVLLPPSSSGLKTGDAKNFVIRKLFAQGATPGRLTIGRAPDNDIQLDMPQVSKHHAVLGRDAQGFTLEDLGSTNGVYVNGRRTVRCRLQPTDVVQLGPFLLRLEPDGIAVFDTRSRARIDVLDLIKEVPNRDGSGKLRLLDRVRLSIPPNEFVGLLGPSGAGKSTLMDALNGMRPAEQGMVLINGLNLYQNINSFKQSIGYVPQDDIIHRELTVERTLYYAAKMRLSADTSDEEIERIITEALDVTGLTERRAVPVGQLSGGQRKRVSIAVELVTQPGIIFLDEPTSGLDPATEEKIMHLFRRIASGGHSVILTTHAMENVKLFDKIVVLMRGRLVWYGPPQEALEYFNIRSIKDLFDTLGDPNSDTKAEEWRRKFEQSAAYHRYITTPLNELSKMTPVAVRPRSSRPTLFQSLRQTLVLASRYARVMLADRLNLAILFGQAPIIALLTALAVGETWARDFPYFVLALSAIWFGCSNAAREIVKETSIYRRERMVNLGIAPYISSKLLVLALIGLAQVTLLYGVMAAAESVPGPPWLILLYLLLSHLVGVAMGLLISALVRTSEMATSLVPLVLIPQILFGGLLLPNEGWAKTVGFFMPAMWSYDALKRVGVEWGGLGILRGQDDDDEAGEIGRIKVENRKAVDDFREKLADYRRRQQQKFDAYKDDMESFLRTGGSRPPSPTLDPEPTAPEVKYLPSDKSRFVSFLHDFGRLWLNFAALGAFFFVLVALTALALRGKDIL
ncbi:MAG: FHA domain-containing protein [Chloracidobacterium sp.]|nr:FHA domain-containing protein [Chloracidobacterium sp.]